MLWTPKFNQPRIITNVATTGAAITGTSVPTHATTLTYGVLTEIISSGTNNQDSWGFLVLITGTGGSATISDATCDLYIGGATDDILAKGLICGYRNYVDGPGYASYFFPCHIPAGKRIAAQMVSVRSGSINCSVQIYLYGGGVPPYRVGGKITTLGAQSTNARGVSITPAESGGAQTATQIIASTAADYFAMIPGFQVHGDSSIATDGNVAINIGVGTATEEKLSPTFIFGKETSEAMNGPTPYVPAFAEVKAGTRVVLFTSNSTTNDAGYNGNIYAVS